MRNANNTVYVTVDQLRNLKHYAYEMGDPSCQAYITYTGPVIVLSRVVINTVVNLVIKSVFSAVGHVLFIAYGAPTRSGVLLPLCLLFKPT